MKTRKPISEELRKKVANRLAKKKADNQEKDKSFTAHDDAVSDGCVMCGNEWKSLNSEGYCSSCWTIWKS